MQETTSIFTLSSLHQVNFGLLTAWQNISYCLWATFPLPTLSHFLMQETTIVSYLFRSFLQAKYREGTISIPPFLYLFVSVFTYHAVCLSIYPAIHISIHLFIYLTSINKFSSLSVRVPFLNSWIQYWGFQSIRLYIYCIYICLYINPSFYLYLAINELISPFVRLSH